MYRYQIRMSKSMSVEDVIEIAASRAWFLIQHRLDSEEFNREYYPEFRKEILQSFLPFLKAYDLCGVSSICSDEASPLNPRHACIFLEERIRHLILPFKLDFFLNQIALRVLQTIRPILKYTSDEKFLATLKMFLSSTLSDYFWLNPWCGKVQICRYSRAIDPWGDLQESSREATNSQLTY